jgi:hypothetical protein
LYAFEDGGWSERINVDETKGCEKYILTSPGMLNP